MTSQLTNWIEKPERLPKWAEAGIGFLVALGAMLAIQFSSQAIVDNDGYYHIRWSWMLRHSLPHLPQFRWLPLTVLEPSRYVDHHFLFHVLLMPFTFGDLRIGAKLAAALFGALAVGALFALLVAEDVRHRWVWYLPLLAGAEPFLYRMSMTRAPSLSLVLLAACLYLMLHGRLPGLLVLTFLFVWLYSMFPLVVVFAGFYLVAVLLSEQRLEWRPLAATLGGALLGLLINPYFPKNLLLIREHLHMVLHPPAAVDVGVEWYSYEAWDMLTGCAVSFAVYFLGLVRFDFRKRSSDLRPLFFLLISVALLIVFSKWRRFVEYWPPFAVLFAAFAWNSSPGPEAEAAPVGVAVPWAHRITVLGANVLVIALGLLALGNLWRAGKELREEPNPFAYQGAAAWLKAHTPEGSMVFNTDWDEFPMLFYYDQHNVYVTGLDTRYLADYNPALWSAYSRVTQGEEADAAPIIRDRFGAQYVVTANESTDFLDAANSSGGFENVYHDSYAVVLRIRAKGSMKN